MIGAVWRPLLIYAMLLLVFRTNGKRALNQTTTFDFVLLLVISEAIASTLLVDDHSMTAAGIAVITMLGANAMMAFGRQRWQRVDRFLSHEPTLLMHEGELLEANMKREDISVHDILEAARQTESATRLRDIRFVVLEANGTLSVLTYSGTAAHDAQ